MKIQYMSDLHLEFQKNKPLQFDVTGEVLVLAGDISTGLGARDWINSLSNKYRAIIYIAGNHEFYHQEYYDTLERLDKGPWKENVYFLDFGKTIQIDDVTFIGDTLWTDLSDPINAQTAKYSMNDYQIVKIGEYPTRRELHPEDTTADYFATVKALTKLMNEITTKIVVITHHLPHPNSVPEAYKTSNNSAYMTDLSEFMEKHVPDLWIHGHTHDSCDYTHDKTRVVCNPRGYYPDYLNKQFDPNKFVEI